MTGSWRVWLVLSLSLLTHTVAGDAKNVSQQYIDQIVAEFGNNGQLTADDVRQLANQLHIAEVSNVASDQNTTVPSCLNLTQLLYDVDIASDTNTTAGAISDQLFSELCPALLYHSAVSSCVDTAAPDIVTSGPTPADHHDHDHDDHHNHDHDHDSHNDDVMSQSRHSSPSYQLWLYALLSVLVISMCGLLGVVVVPIMQQLVYRQLLHFLVALAIGTLTGDALLHLLPHALVPHSPHSPSASEIPPAAGAAAAAAAAAGGGGSDGGAIGEHHHHDHDAETEAVWKGVAVLCALLVFFVSERLVAMLHGHCTRHSRQMVNDRLSTMSTLNPEHAQLIGTKMEAYSHTPGAKHCLTDTDTASYLAEMRSSSQQMCSESDVTAAAGTASSSCAALPNNNNSSSTSSKQTGLTVQFQPKSQLRRKSSSSSSAAAAVAGGTASDSNVKLATSRTLCHRFTASDLTPRPDPATSVSATTPAASSSTTATAATAQAAAAGGGAAGRTDSCESSELLLSADGATGGAAGGGGSSTNNFTVIIHEHEHLHHGHTHTHGHIHQHHHHTALGGGGGGRSAGVVVMVILGDALHNFTDGLALGAAFAGGGLAGGVSTAVAVFCHELPHEIGDFAVLLSAGMSLRSALFYNGVSSLLCLAGMVLGMLLVAALPSFSSWLFAFVAGTFLYIALVDMLPELSVEPPAAAVSADGSGGCAADGAAAAGEGGGAAAAAVPSVRLLLLLQVAGMVTGAGIMLAIALHEHTLLNIFTDR